VGTGNPSINTTGFLSGKHYFRARIERGALTSPWSTTVVHGDPNPPNITSRVTDSVMGEVQLAHALTSDKGSEVRWALFGGDDVGQFQISGSTLEWFNNDTQDYWNPSDTDANNIYLVNVRATDLANNFSVQSLAVTVTSNPAFIPTYTEWTKVTGASKSGYAVVSGTPALNLTGTPTVGSGMLVRARAAARNAKFQWEQTIVSEAGNDAFYMGCDDGSANLGAGAFDQAKGFLFSVTPGETFVYYNNSIIADQSLGGGIQTGDVFSLVVDTTTTPGTATLYRTRTGSTVQIGSPLSLSLGAPSNYYAVSGTNNVTQMTANFGQTQFVRALDAGFGVYY
jgi:hypothetical protein